jgi:hypothetical protein
MNQKETFIRRIIYRRLSGIEFVTSGGIHVPIEREELDRRISDVYPKMLEIDGIISDLLDLPLSSEENSSVLCLSGGMDLSEMPDPRKSIIEIHRNIKGSDYHSPELYRLPIPIRRKEWDMRHFELLKENDLEVTVKRGYR